MLDVNKQITPNFRMSEAFTWIRLFSPMLEGTFMKWCQEEWTAEKEQRLIREFKRLQSYRDAINRKFPEHGGRIGVRITSGVRPQKYEELKGRGHRDSRHKHWDAFDFDVVNVPEPKRSAILRWLWTDIDHNHTGGAAISIRQDNTIAFIHVDGRGVKARWKY